MFRLFKWLQQKHTSRAELFFNWWHILSFDVEHCFDLLLDHFSTVLFRPRISIAINFEPHLAWIDIHIKYIPFHIFNTSHCTHKGRVFHNIRKHLKHCEQLLLCVYYFNGKKLNYCPKEKYLGQLPILKTLLASQKTRRYKKRV